MSKLQTSIARIDAERIAIPFLGEVDLFDVTIICPHGTTVIRTPITVCQRADHVRPEDCEAGLARAMEDVRVGTERHFLEATECPCGVAYTAARGELHGASARTFSTN